MRKWNLFLWLLVGVLFIFFSLFEIEFEQEEPKRETASAVYVFDGRGPKETVCFERNGINILLFSVSPETREEAEGFFKENGWKEASLKVCTDNENMKSLSEIHLVRYGKVSGVDFLLLSKTGEEKRFKAIKDFSEFLKENPQL